MARTDVTTQQLPYAGLQPVHTAPIIDGDIVDVGRCFLSVINGGAGDITVTVQTPETVDGDLAIEDRTVTVPVSTTPTLIPLTSPRYRQPAGSTDAGRAYVDYSSVTSVTRAVVSL